MDGDSLILNNNNVQNVVTTGITIFYSKRTGEVMAYSACSTPQTFENYYGTQAEDMKIIYNSIFTDFDIDIIHDPKSFYVDTTNKMLKKKVDPIEELRDMQATQDNLIDTNLIANAGLFEIILSSGLLLTKSIGMHNDSIVNVYVALIKRDKKSIEEVPEIIRNQVQETLEFTSQ